jgi:hypothetical protein
LVHISILQIVLMSSLNQHLLKTVFRFPIDMGLKNFEFFSRLA